MWPVLITGTSKGIGFETTLAFGRAGHKVFATMRNPSQSPQLAETAVQEKLPITVSTMDVDFDQSVSQCIAQIQRDHGPIDVLVNNAGVKRVGSVEELALSDFRAVTQTNYFGAIRCIQALVPDMRRRRSGCIIVEIVESGTWQLRHPVGPDAAHSCSGAAKKKQTKNGWT